MMDYPGFPCGSKFFFSNKTIDQIPISASFGRDLFFYGANWPVKDRFAAAMSPDCESNWRGAIAFAYSPMSYGVSTNLSGDKLFNAEQLMQLAMKSDLSWIRKIVLHNMCFSEQEEVELVLFASKTHFPNSFTAEYIRCRSESLTLESFLLLSGVTF